jgi:hypothetical protein
MMLRREYGLAGKFKFDVYSKDGTLKSTTDYIDNFITSTGLSYVHNYAFADCFRYLSLGSGTTANNITTQDTDPASPTFNQFVGTTGLAIPLPQYSYIGGNPLGCLDGAYDVSQYVANGCSYRVDPTGVALNRAWRVPADTTKFFTNAHTFKEYMLSPGRTGMSGFMVSPFSEDGGNTILTGACNCWEAVNTLTGMDGDYFYGKEDYNYNQYYPNICKATKAFSRIIKDVVVDVDEYLVVNYALTVNYDTGVRLFKIAVSRNSPEDPLGFNTNFGAGTSVSGFSSLVHPGIKLISDGTVTSVASANQIPGYETPRIGEAFAGPLGIAMEPSCPLENRMGYISNDGYQFIVNDYLGGAYDPAAFKPDSSTGRQFPSGNCGFHRDWIEDTSSNDATLGDAATQRTHFYRIRTPTSDTLGSSYADMSDYRNATTASSLVDSVVNQSTFDMTFSPQIVEPVKVTHGPVVVTFSGRSRAETVDFQFQTFTDLPPTGMPIRSFVYAYKYVDGIDDQWFATMDSYIFPYTTSKPPSVPNRTTHKYYSQQAPVSSPSSTGYYYMDTTNILQMQVKLSWNSSCPAAVGGC